MADEQYDDALFDRLAKGLQAVRRDADLVRSSGAEGISTALAKAEAELLKLASNVAALDRRSQDQQAIIETLLAAGTSTDADLKGLRQTVGRLSARLQEQVDMAVSAQLPNPAPPPAPSRSTGPNSTQGPNRSPASSAQAPTPARKAPASAAALIGFVLAVVTLCGGAAAWVAADREPTIAAMTHELLVRLSDFSGIDLAGPGPREMVGTAAQPNLLAKPLTPAPVDETRPVSASPPATPVVPEPRPPAAATQSSVSETVIDPAPTSTDKPALETPSPASKLPQANAAAQVVTSPHPSPPAAGGTQAIAEASLVKPNVPTEMPSPVPAPATNAGDEPQAHTHIVLDEPPRLPLVTHQLMLRATADSWVQVRDKTGRMLLRRIMKQGETWLAPVEPDLLLDSGNAGGVELDVDGVPQKPLGTRGGVVRDVSLDALLASSGTLKPR